MRIKDHVKDLMATANDPVNHPSLTQSPSGALHLTPINPGFESGSTLLARRASLRCTQRPRSPFVLSTTTDCGLSDPRLLQTCGHQLLLR